MNQIQDIPALSLEDSVRINRLRLSVMEEELRLTLPIASPDQVAKVVASAEGFESVKVPGFNTLWRLSDAQAEEVKAARKRHSAAATAAKGEIAQSIATASEVKRFKVKLNRDGKKACTCNWVS